MKRYLKKLGLQISEAKPTTAQELTEIMVVVMEIHDQMMEDIILQPAAYGCAIGGLSLALDVNLRTAAMLFEEWRRLHQSEQPITVVIINPTKEDNKSG